MKTSILTGSAFFLLASGMVMAGDDHPAFSEADMNKDGVLSVQEASAALPELRLQSATPTSALTTADVKKVLPEVEFSTETTETSTIGEDEYQLIVDAVMAKASKSAVSSNI